jgi:hypothetical protein
MKIVRLILVIALLAVGVLGLLDLNSIKGFDQHQAYCNRLNDAASLYVSSPYANKEFYKNGHTILQGIVNQGNVKFKVISASSVNKRALQVKDGSTTIQGWDDWGKSVISSYMEFEVC